MDKLRDMLLKMLHDRYPGDIPAFIKERFESEWEYFSWMTVPDDLDRFLFLYHEIVKVAEAAGQPVWNCGLGSGSFLFYLLDKGLNPLEPHWQCGKCSYVETDEQADLCFDLPVKLCPKCRSRMARDGIHGSPEAAFHGSHMELRVNEDFLDTATEATLYALKGFRVFRRYWNHDPGPADYRSYFYTTELLQEDKRLIHQDESGAEYINVDDRKAFISFLPSLTIKAQTGDAMLKNPISMEEWIECKPDIQALLERNIQDMKEQDCFCPDNTQEQILEMIGMMRPETWTNLIKIIGYASGNYSRLGKLKNRAMVELIQSSKFHQILYAQEPLQFFLRKQGILEILDRQMVEQLITGRKGWEMELFGTETPLLDKDKLFSAVIYLRSRTQVINWLWRYFSR